LLYFMIIHKSRVNGSVLEVYNAAGDTVIFKFPLSADQEQTEMTRGKAVSGP